MILTVLANGIENEVGAFIENAELDKETYVAIVAYLKNQYDAQGEKIEVGVDLPVGIALTKSDITEGKESVQEIVQNGKRLRITLKEIGPFEGIAIKFEKKKIIVKLRICNEISKNYSLISFSIFI